MKSIYKIFVLSIVSVLFSCTADIEPVDPELLENIEDNGSNNGGGNNGGGNSGGNQTNVFNYTYQGSEKTVTEIIASKSEASLAVIGKMDNGQRIEFKFDKYGNLGEVSSYSATDFNFIDTDNHYNFSSNYFTFTLQNLDEVNKRVKVSFSGKLYTDEDDLTSEFVTISGNFEVTYVDVAPSIPGLEVFAKIAGSNWYSTKQNESTFDTLNFLSDDAYSISFRFNSSIVPGNYNFNNQSTSNFVFLSKHKVEGTSDYYEPLNGSGSINLTSKTEYSIGYIYEGTYSFTATNPNDNSTIQVTEGKFKFFDF